MTDISKFIDELSRRSGPCLTWYSASGERIELSGRVFANWVIKSANLLADELELDEDSVVRIAMSPHWRTVVMAFAAWSLGAEVSFDATASRADLLVTESPATEESSTDAEPESASGIGLEALGSWQTVLVISLPALGPPPASPPDGATYYNSIVAGMPDDRVFVEASASRMIPPPLAAGVVPAELSSWMSAVAEASGAVPGGRVLVTCEHGDRSTILAIASILEGASVVLADLNTEALARIQVTEHATPLRQP